MSRIKSAGTKPEIVVRKVLSQLGQRYRLHSGKLPGKPDIVMSRIGKVIFVNGCFWHQHKGCKRQVMPKTNRKYWETKLQRNLDKQKDDIRKLKKEGWAVHVVWECETKDENQLASKLAKII